MIPKKRFFALFILVAIIALCYANTFHIPWQLDDPPNITDNYILHITNLQPDTLWQTFFALPFSEGHLYRPIVNLSFALNWYFGQDNPFGYHLVNLLIHILTAFFLYKTIIFLLESHSFKTRYNENDAHFIALLVATLWAINPVQTQAVTYIVQRMASMAAMFVIFTLYNYVRARQAENPKQTFFRITLCALCFILALGCKENTVTLIPSLLLLEIFFLHKNNHRSSKIFLTCLVAANICFILAGLYYILSQHYIQTFFTPVGSRPFSIYERLLTQPAILLFYLSLLLYPNPTRLSIDHSFPLATSLFHPWTTLPAILFIAALLIFAILRYRKNPLLSFAILFFFINHLIESSFIPLELIFEHRNYLPSFFLFLPIAAGIRYAINACLHTRRLVYFTLVIAFPFLMVMIGLGTYSRNAVWATEESLWTDALKKAPHNARPYAKLGEIYGWQKEKTPENLQISVTLLKKAVDRESPRTSFQPAIINNIGKVYANYGMLDEAIVYYNQSLELNPNFINARLDLANALTLAGKFSQALEEINIVIAKNDQQSRFFALKTLLLLWLDRPEEAAESSSQAMKRTIYNKERYFYNSGVALSKAGYEKQGLWFLNQALQQHPEDLRIHCSLIENRILANERSGAEKYALQLLNIQSIGYIKSRMESLRTEYAGAPINVDLISPIIIETAQNFVAQLKQESTIK